MESNPANHYVINGNGVEGIVDTASITGSLAVSLTLDGKPLEDGSVEPGPFGLLARATVEAVPDSHTVTLYALLPEVNVDDQEVQFASVAIIVTARTSIGGPSLVKGAVQSYDLRPIAGAASSVHS